MTDKKFKGIEAIEKDIQKLSKSKNIKFDDLVHIVSKYFGKPRITGSHHVFKTPWQGKPMINLQPWKKMAAPYQVKQVIKALEQLKELEWRKTNV